MVGLPCSYSEQAIDILQCDLRHSTYCDNISTSRTVNECSKKMFCLCKHFSRNTVKKRSYFFFNNVKLGFAFTNFLRFITQNKYFNYLYTLLYILFIYDCEELWYFIAVFFISNKYKYSQNDVCSKSFLTSFGYFHVKIILYYYQIFLFQNGGNLLKA